MNESETRAELIDPALKRAGWGVVDGSVIRREFQISPGRIHGAGRRARAEIADYVLVYRNIKLAVIEAKARDLPVNDGVMQAKSYAGMLDIRFTYSANGNAIYGIDMETGQEGDVSDFPSPDELWGRTFAKANRWRDRFAAIPFEDKGGTWQGRYYQDVAVKRVLDAIASGRSRLLLTLATGTGKTFIAFQLAWKLFHAKWNLTDWQSDGEPTRRPRILFLADRNILADQAYNSFSAFDDDALVRIAPDQIRQNGRVPTNGSVFFTIFQTFMSGPGETPYFGDYPPDFFDFIIVDECHRGGAKDESSWHEILTYFEPAVQLGLTATPLRRQNANTFTYFGEPVYSYSLREGINDGFLTPFRVKQIATTLDDYVYTPDDALVEGEIIAGKLYTEADFNRSIEIREREEYRVRTWMELVGPYEKTLVFCATQEHAGLVRDLINQNKKVSDPLYCVRVTADDGARGEEYLHDFQDNEKTIPAILTTSQKLSTGVDARNVRNIVLMRPVNSMIEFKQIVGRGTRLYEGKDYFTIYDFVRAHEHFSDPEWDGDPLSSEPIEPRGARDTVDQADGDSQPRPDPALRPTRASVRLADGKERKIQSMMVTTFWSADGRPMSAGQFLESMFGVLPDFFKDEDELRRIWADPETRGSLLSGLSDKGFSRDALTAMQQAIEAEDSDVFDVLAYVAYARAPITRAKRAEFAKSSISQEYVSDRRAAFLDFVLDHYVSEGVDELSLDKLAPLLQLKYYAINDAFAELGTPDQIRDAFVGFQQYLYPSSTTE
ncbi:DEAD/DEAH box helicase family protein [Luteimonas sp. FXH3W]|uniref:DEAD/DEAH box helicase family protein n=1 Tax=Aquilutibacter rugosus TaxID=3115820 RepID=A0ABU7UWP6_9GAMM